MYVVFNLIQSLFDSLYTYVGARPPRVSDSRTVGQSDSRNCVRDARHEISTSFRAGDGATIVDTDDRAKTRRTRRRDFVRARGS